MIDRMLANCTVSDQERAESWYTRLFDRGPDTRPMPGLIEWHLSDTFGLQIWTEPARAGRSSVVFDVTDLDEAAMGLTESGIEHAGIEPGGGARIIQISDPDGNRVVFAGR